MGDTKIKGGGSGIPVAAKDNGGDVPKKPEQLKGDKNGDVGKSDFINFDHPFGKYIAERFFKMAGRQEFYASGSPKVGTKSGESVFGIGKLKWTQTEYTGLCHFVASHINPALKMQIEERVGEAGFQKFVQVAAKTIANYHTPTDYNPVIGKEDAGQKVS